MQGHEGIGEQVVAEAVAAIIVGHRRSDRQIDQPQLFIRAHQGPDIGAAGVFPGVVWPGIVAKLAGMGDCVENPAHLARARIESAHMTGGRLAIVGAFGHGRTHHDDIADDYRRGTHGIERRIDGSAEAALEIDTAGAAEFRVGPAGRRIDGQQESAATGIKQPFFVAISPMRETPRHESVHRGPPIEIKHRVETPERFPGSWIDGGDLAEGGRRVQHAVYHQRRHFIGVSTERTAVLHDLVVFPQCLVQGIPGPGDLQALHVVRVDLIEGRVFRVRGIASIAAPFAVLGSLLRQSGIGAQVGAQARRQQRKQPMSGFGAKRKIHCRRTTHGSPSTTISGGDPSMVTATCCRPSTRKVTGGPIGCAGSATSAIVAPVCLSRATNG